MCLLHVFSPFSFLSGLPTYVPIYLPCLLTYLTYRVPDQPTYLTLTADLPEQGYSAHQIYLR